MPIGVQFIANCFEENKMIAAGQTFYTLSPDDYDYLASYNAIYSSGNSGSTELTITQGVRPVISLVPDIEYLYGDGSMEHPYQIDDGTH